MDRVHDFSGVVYSHYTAMTYPDHWCRFCFCNVRQTGSESAAFKCSVGVLSGQEELVLTQFRM